MTLNLLNDFYSEQKLRKKIDKPSKRNFVYCVLVANVHHTLAHIRASHTFADKNLLLGKPRICECNPYTHTKRFYALRRDKHPSQTNTNKPTATTHTDEMVLQP